MSKKSEQSILHRFRASLTVLVIAILAMLTTTIGASSANADVKSGTFAYGSAIFRASQGIYNGSMRATTAGVNVHACVEMVRLKSGGNPTNLDDWVNTGFHPGASVPASGSDPTAHITSCTLTLVPWHLINPAAVDGIGMLEPDTRTLEKFCSTQAQCRALS